VSSTHAPHHVTMLLIDRCDCMVIKTDFVIVDGAVLVLVSFVLKNSWLVEGAGTN